MKKLLCVILCVFMLIPAIPAAAFVEREVAGTAKTFEDLEPGKWYYEAALWCVSRDLMSGTSDTSFAPGAPVTRAMFVTVLARISRADTSDYTGTSFLDVPEGKWYSAPIEWAYRNGYASGIGGGKFGPGDPVTREQLAVFLYNLSGKFNLDVGSADGLERFTDAGEISGWALDAVKWAVAEGLISGTSDSTLSPKAGATRAQLAVIVKKFMPLLVPSRVAFEPEDGFLYMRRLEEVYAIYYANEPCAYAEEVLDNLAGTLQVYGTPIREEGAFRFEEKFHGDCTFLVEYYNGESELYYHRFTNDAPIALSLNGVAIKEFRIVYGQTGTIRQKASAEDAARDLAEYLYRTTGFHLEVASDRDVAPAEGAYEILIGRTNREDAGLVTIDRSGMETDAFIYKVDGNYLIFASNEKYFGTFDAVNAFERNVLGCDFFGNGCETQGAAGDTDLPDGTEYTDAPLFDYNMNYQRQGGDLKLGGSETYNAFCNGVHSIPEFCQPDYRTDWDFHLQYYMSPDPCVSDPANLEMMVTNVKKLMDHVRAKNGGDTLIWFTQSDANTFCRCERCAKIYRLWGRCATYVMAMNYVAEAIKDDYPEFKLVSLSYKYTVIPPKTADQISDEEYQAFVDSYVDEDGRPWAYVPPKDLSAPDSAIVCVCTDSICSSHAIDDPKCMNATNNNVTYNSFFDTWTEFYNTIYVWDYLNGDVYKHSPFPNTYEMYQNFNYYSRHNVRGVYALGTCDHVADFGELHTYLEAKLAWDPTITQDEYLMMVNRFLAAYYGAGWMNIRYYIDLTEELSDKNEWHIWGGNHWYECITEEQYRDNIDAMLAMWQDALDAAGTDAQKTHVKEGMIQVKYIELQLIYREHVSTGNDPDVFYRYNREYADLMQEVGFNLPYDWTEGGNPDGWANN